MPISYCPCPRPTYGTYAAAASGQVTELLEKKSLDQIVVQKITHTATVNRATFYDHYRGKFVLFHVVVASDFHSFLAERNLRFDGPAPSELAAMIHALCDYLNQS